MWPALRLGHVARTAAGVEVTESARAHSYILSEEVRKICKFWMLTFWLFNVSPLVYT